MRDVPNLLGILKSLGLAGGNVAIMKTGNGNLDDKLDDNIGTDLEEFVVEATDDEGGGDQEKEGIEQLDQEQDDDGEDVVDEERDEVVDEEEVEGDEESEEVSDEADDHDLEKEEQPVAEEQGGVDAEVENESNDATPKDLEDEEDDGNQSEASDIAPNDTGQCETDWLETKMMKKKKRILGIYKNYSRALKPGNVQASPLDP